MCIREGKGFGDGVERERDLGRGEAWKDNTKKKGGVRSQPKAIYIFLLLLSYSFVKSSMSSSEFVMILFSYPEKYPLFLPLLFPAFLLSLFCLLTRLFHSLCAFFPVLSLVPSNFCLSAPFTNQSTVYFLPIALCLLAAEEASSLWLCLESTCGSGSSFSPPFCARTSVSFRTLRQVRPGVQISDLPHFLTCLAP